jgi:soluble lytic murein transglycosylase
VKQLVFFFLIFFIALGMSTHCVADFSRGIGYKPTVAPDRFEQRQMYLDAIHLIKTSQFSRLQKLKPQLRTYPLYPYLEYTEISYRISRQSEQDILRFVEQYKDTPLVESLLAHWLSNLAKRGKWEIFVTHYDKVTPTKKLACQHAYGLYKVGMVDQALTQAEKLWTVGFSQPDECDSIFNVWRGANGITPEIAWQRFALSLKENNKDLASYLIRFVDRQDKPFATNYRLIHLKPKTIKRYKSFKATNIRNREIILHGVKRLSRLDPEDALLTLEKYEKLQDFNPDELEDAYTYIGVRLAGKSSDLALVDSLPVNLHEHPKLVEARIRQNLKHGDWSNVMVLINLLPQEQQKSNRWQYWKARALGLSADEADREIARNVMIELSSERSFYGFVSADILQNQYNYQDEPSPVTLEQILSLEESPGIQRALELFALGERSQARREWYFSTSDFNNVERDVAARVALRWGWYKASIQTMIDAGAWNHLDHRFPIAYADTFITHARRANIPVQWSLAIARQESSFMTDAKSSAGALGVMQLMPATAKQVAAKIGVSYPNNRSLTSPDLNIRLGTNYLAQMLRKFDNNRILASAAYNAGPGRVNQWLNPNVPFDVWIEIIPFTETRNYVQNVLMFSSIYSRRMNERQPLIYAHERNYFSPQQVSAIQALAEKLSVKPPENT